MTNGTGRDRPSRPGVLQAACVPLVAIRLAKEL